MEQTKDVKEIILIQERYKVSKSNLLIDSIYNLTSLEQKVLISMISLLSPETDDFLTYKVPLSVLKGIIGTDSKAFHKQIKDLTFSILTKPFWYKDKDTGREIQGTFFSTIEYNKGVLEVEFSPKVKALLLNLKSNFTTYMLGFAVKLKSKYSIRLYELLKKNERLGSVSFKIEELKSILAIDNQYKLYGHFKDRVLETSRKEINKHTDIKFRIVEDKQGGKKVISIKFIISENKKNIKGTPDLLGREESSYSIEKQLTDLKVYPKLAREIINKYHTKIIEDKLKQYKFEYSINPEKINEKGSGAYLYEMITKDFINNDYEGHKLAKVKKEKKQFEKEEKKRVENLEKEYELYIENSCEDYKLLDLKDKREIDNIVENQMEETDYIKGSSDLFQLTVSRLRRQAIKDFKRKELGSFEEWCSNR